MKFISLFAGIGGLDLGLERAGMECVAQVEKEPFCLEVLTKHWAHVPKYKDVLDVGKHNLPTADLICGGFPCQDVSLTGKRAGLEGKRSTLWSEYFRIICEIRPRWALAENVPGLLSSDNGEFFTRILRQLSSIGYDVEWHTIPAASFGAVHIRERVFILAYPAGNKLQGRAIVPPPWSEQPRKEQLSGLLQSRFRSTLPKRGNDRNNNGVPRRMDKLRSLGNAVYPPVAEYIGQCVLKAEACLTKHAPDKWESAPSTGIFPPSRLSTSQSESTPPTCG